MQLHRCTRHKCRGVEVMQRSGAGAEVPLKRWVELQVQRYYRCYLMQSRWCKCKQGGAEVVPQGCS